MNGTPLVSVVIIFLDAEHFLEEAIESVFAQDYPAWELLLVDDGSADGGSALARGWAARHPGRVRYLEHPGHANRGVSAARNLGVAHARGAYMAFLDADDVWLPAKLAEQVAILEAHPEAAMVYGLSQWWYSWTGEPEDQGRDFVHELGAPAETLFRPPALFAPFFSQQRGAIPNPSNVLVRREIVERVGGFEEAFRGVNQIYEDQAFISKICLAGGIFASGRCWDRYRQHPDSSSAALARSGREHEARRFFLTWLGAYLIRAGVQDRTVWRALRRASWRYRHPRLARTIMAGRRAAETAAWQLVRAVARRTLPVAARRRLRAGLGSYRRRPATP